MILVNTAINQICHFLFDGQSECKIWNITETLASWGRDPASFWDVPKSLWQWWVRGGCKLKSIMDKSSSPCARDRESTEQLLQSEMEHPRCRKRLLGRSFPSELDSTESILIDTIDLNIPYFLVLFMLFFIELVKHVDFLIVGSIYFSSFS